MMTNLTPKSDQTGVAGGCGARSDAAGPLVLVIEDHEDTRFLLRVWLEMRGCRVVEAESGESGVKQVETLRPDLILLDRGLPGMSGISTMCRIREQSDLRHIPVVILSGHTLPTDYQEAFDAGCDDYLIKPIDFDQWGRMLARHLPQFKPDAVKGRAKDSRNE